MSLRLLYITGKEAPGLRSLPYLKLNETIRLQQYVTYVTYIIAVKLLQFM